jgi:dynein heavy chain, axonemal
VAEWHEGIFSHFLSLASSDESENKHWIILDGPIDTLWIESMNSLLDDSRKLCLSNGQIIKTSEYTKIIFETDNLDNTSPAIVSRLGILFMNEDDISIEQIWQSWIIRQPDIILNYKDL